MDENVDMTLRFLDVHDPRFHLGKVRDIHTLTSKSRPSGGCAVTFELLDSLCRYIRDIDLRSAASSARAVALPIPLAPPVTRLTRFSRLRLTMGPTSWFVTANV